MRSGKGLRKTQLLRRKLGDTQAELHELGTAIGRKFTFVEQIRNSELEGQAKAGINEAAAFKVHQYRRVRNQDLHRSSSGRLIHASRQFAHRNPQKLRGL